MWNQVEEKIELALVAFPPLRECFHIHGTALTLMERDR